jgi:hypothetical protein
MSGARPVEPGAAAPHSATAVAAPAAVPGAVDALPRPSAADAPPPDLCPSCGSARPERYCPRCGERRAAADGLRVRSVAATAFEEIFGDDGRVAFVQRPSRSRLRSGVDGERRVTAGDVQAGI